MEGKKDFGRGKNKELFRDKVYGSGMRISRF